MPKDSIYVQTQDKEVIQTDKGITSKHWKIYYYLLSVSKFNSQRVEDHRYVYKKDFNIAACCRFLGVKSKQTFYNAIQRLHDHHLVTDDGEHYLLYTRTPIDVKIDVLSNLIEYSAGKTKEGNIDLLRTYLILKRINKLAENINDRQFTKRELIILLGHSGQTSEMYDNIRNYLGLLSMWGFIDIKLHTSYDEKLGKYTVYHLQDVLDTPKNEDYITDIIAEKNVAVMSQSMKDKLCFSENQIMEN